MTADDTPQILPLSRFAGNGGWRLALQHDRDDHLMIRLTRGSGHALIRANRQTLTPNSTLFVPAGTLFSFVPGLQAIGTVLQIPTSAEIDLPADAHLLRTPNLLDQTALSQLIEAMQREQTNEGTYHGAAARAHATLIAIWLRRAVLDQPPRPTPGADARLAAAFADLVARNYRANLAMATHAETLGVSPTHLSRSCKSACGLSAADILTERSLHGARSLLADTDHSIGKIATHLGFHSNAYFSRFVLKHTGKSPSDLRAAARAAKVTQTTKPFPTS